jgi:hypothetical protein
MPSGALIADLSLAESQHNGGQQSCMRSILLMVILAGAAFSLETRVIPASDLSKRVPMTTIAYERDSFAGVRTSDFVIAEAADGQKFVRGRDKSRKRWEAVLPAPTHGIWKTELNGVPTYYFAGYTGGAGTAPGAWILVLSFDERGRPVPFYVMSYADYDRNGINDLLNLDGNGPQLLHQKWVETPPALDSRAGYYITTLYQQRGVYWYRTDGRHGLKTFPLYERWVMLPKREPEEVAAPEGANEWRTDYGNDPRIGVRSTILSASDRGIIAGPELGCNLDSIDVVVRDSKDGREIELKPFFAGNSGPVLEKIAAAHLPVVFTGVNGKGRCDAAVAWADSSSK